MLWIVIFARFGYILWGKMTIEIVSGETNYREFFHKVLATIGVGGLFYMMIEIFFKKWGC